MKKTVTTKIEETTKGEDCVINTQDLRRILFEEIGDLRNGKSSPQRAVAVSKLATNIINTAVLDIKSTKIVQDSERNRLEAKEVSPLSLLHS